MRTEEKQKPCEWKDYKAVSLNGVYLGGFFQDDQSLLNWVNTQKLINPCFTIGDGHSGIWKLYEQIGNSEQRVEILDWFHLKENLYKVKVSKKKLEQAENLLWCGKVESTIELLKNNKRKQAKNFCKYLEKHQKRIINYDYYQEEQISSIGSGMIESGVKQIGKRIKISGAQWEKKNVNKILSVRCAYLNGFFYQ